MSENSEKNPTQTEVFYDSDLVKQSDLLPNNCLKNACVTKKTETQLVTAYSDNEGLEKIIEQRAENGVESKSDITTNSCSSSTFGSFTSPESISNDSSPSRNDNNNELALKILEEQTENDVLYEQTAEITLKHEINSNLNENCSLEPRILSVSTASLNDGANYVTTLSKTGYSKSADNLCNVNDNSTTNTRSSDLDAEKILSEFSSQKTKVTATQKIIPETENADYTRIPIEILSQDLGSIVKNVHGIFSSVSGSIKNAYNNSHNYRTHKPVKPIKVIPNNKILNEIFDEDADNVEQETQNSESTNSESSEVTKESLEKMLADQRKEISLLKERARQQAEEMQSKDQTVKDVEGKMETMRKRLENAEREKDAAVMRYAGGERAIIEARRAADTALKGEKSVLSELELVNGKLKSAHAEKQRIIMLYDDKCHELQTSEREVAKLKEDQKELEGRLKWTQSKLRMEMDAYKDSAEKVEKLEKQIVELEAAKEAAANNAADSLRAKQLEQELRESQAALILCKHEKDDLERRLTSVTARLEACESEREGNSTALALANDELKQLRESNLRLEEEASQLASLRATAALAQSLSTQLQREAERASQAEEALSIERARAETCARREARALEHAARLTHDHVAARQAAEDHSAKVQALTADNASLREKLAQLEEETNKLNRALADETERRNRENKALARKVAELTEELSEAHKQLEWEKGENGVLQKKHASAIKEINRELQRALKRCDQLEARLPQNEPDGSRTGSISSLSSAESASVPERLQNGHSSDAPDVQAKAPDRQALVERIVRLQRAAARRAERCDFLEEHCRQLTADCRDKSRLLRQALCRDAPPSEANDMKRDIARFGGGAMAAMWGGDVASLPHDLSIEMNRRLQAVLEDALLKNICLKENIDTLSKEIARLKAAGADSTSK